MLSKKVENEFINWFKNNTTVSEVLFIEKCLLNDNIKGLISYLILYFDSVDIQITIYCWDNNKYSLTILLDGRYLKIYKERFDSREQAWTQAVEKANEIRNEQLCQQ